MVVKVGINGFGRIGRIVSHSLDHHRSASVTNSITGLPQCVSYNPQEERERERENKMTREPS